MDITPTLEALGCSPEFIERWTSGVRPTRAELLAMTGPLPPRPLPQGEWVTWEYSAMETNDLDELTYHELIEASNLVDDAEKAHPEARVFLDTSALSPRVLVEELNPKYAAYQEKLKTYSEAFAAANNALNEWGLSLRQARAILPLIPEN